MAEATATPSPTSIPLPPQHGGSPPPPKLPEGRSFFDANVSDAQREAVLAAVRAVFPKANIEDLGCTEHLCQLRFAAEGGFVGELQVIREGDGWHVDVPESPRLATLTVGEQEQEAALLRYSWGGVGWDME